MTQRLDRAMDVLQEAHDEGDVPLEAEVEFKAPDGTIYSLGQFEYDESRGLLTVDLKKSED